MTPQEEIDALSAGIRTATQQHGNAPLRLEINDLTFRGTTPNLWKANNWTIHDDEANAVMNGNEDERRKALLSFLKLQGIAEVKFLPGTEVLNVVKI